MAGVTTLVTAVTGLHILNVQIQRHRNHMPWYDQDDFWMSALHLPSPQYPDIPLPEILPMSIDYVHVWNSTSTESNFVEPEDELHVRLNAAVYESNSSAAYIFLRMNSPGRHAGHILNTSAHHIIDESTPMYLSVDYEVPQIPEVDQVTRWFLLAFGSAVAALVLISIGFRRCHLRFESVYSELGVAKAFIEELNRFIETSRAASNETKALLIERNGILEGLSAAKESVISNLQAVIDALTTQIAALQAASVTREAEYERLKSETEAAKAAHARQIEAKDEEIRLLKAANGPSKPAVDQPMPFPVNSLLPKPTSPAPPKAAEHSSHAEAGAKASSEPLVDAPKGPQADTKPLSYSNNTMYFNADARRRDRTNAPLVPPQPTSVKSKPFTVPRLSKAEEKQAIADAVRRVKERDAAAQQAQK